MSAAAQVGGSQIALAASNYLVLAFAARHLDAAGFAALSSYYLLINTVGRGMFAAIELETTRAVAATLALGGDSRPVLRHAGRQTLLLLFVAFVLLGVATPLLSEVVGSSPATLGLLAVGAVGMAMSYLLRGPLAGDRRYVHYAASFWVEAAAGLTMAGILMGFGIKEPLVWMAVLAFAPVLAALAVAPAAFRRSAPQPIRDAAGAAPGGTRLDLFYSATLLLAGQGVWNLAPVLVTYRLADDPNVAAGFVAVAVLLRAPVLLFPAVQALLLPALTTMISTGDTRSARRATRRLAVLIIGGGLVWVILAVTLVPWIARTVFAATVTPPTWILAALALSTVLGAATQIAQTHLLAARRQRDAALAWLIALVIFIVVGLTITPPLIGAVAGQVLAAVIVLTVLGIARRHLLSNGDRL